MYCRGCGTRNEEDARFCNSCGERLTSQEPSVVRPVHVPNHLVWAILVTIFCCMPFGIVSIAYAAQVNGKLASGDLDGAQETSDNAKKWAWVSFWVGVGTTLIGLLLVAVGLVL